MRPYACILYPVLVAVKDVTSHEMFHGRNVGKQKELWTLIAQSCREGSERFSAESLIKGAPLSFLVSHRVLFEKQEFLTCSPSQNKTRTTLESAPRCLFVSVEADKGAHTYDRVSSSQKTRDIRGDRREVSYSGKRAVHRKSAT